jgi:hypothetical protein
MKKYQIASFHYLERGLDWGGAKKAGVESNTD